MKMVGVLGSGVELGVSQGPPHKALYMLVTALNRGL